jgi:hypothetical protein
MIVPCWWIVISDSSRVPCTSDFFSCPFPDFRLFLFRSFRIHPSLFVGTPFSISHCDISHFLHQFGLLSDKKCDIVLDRNA